MLMMTYNHIFKAKPGRFFLTGILLFFSISAQSQIVIGGDVYGGGRNGAVGTANLTDPTKSKADISEIELANSNTATTITINSGTIRTVFGGGEKGRVFGNTSITVQGSATNIGGTINNINWKGSIHGGLFGAGDGSGAIVFGKSNVLINGGNIFQNIYGGGNQADLRGSTNVILRGGKLKGTVFGGARLADIYGYSFVDIDGAQAKEDIVVSAVYGGNDIAGDIHAGGNLTIPSVFTLAGDNHINNEYNAFVHSSLEAANKHIFVGQLFGGGNGDYTYDPNPNDNSLLDMSELTDTTLNANNEIVFAQHTFTVSKTPEVDKVYLELHGGTFGYVYGGGNQATVVENVDICLANETEDANLYTIPVNDLEAMGVSVDESNFHVNNGNATPTFQFDRVFGGNNKADMNLQPTWHLNKASINNLYSGGNAGNMTYSEGLLLVLANDNLTINTVYGGCRMADVSPILPGGQTTINGKSGSVTTANGNISYSFPDDHSARILIAGGDITNVYGGNDIKGNVTGGNAIDIRSSIKGDVYGGGNGSYAYTDNGLLEGDKKYGDFYYSTTGFASSLDALNAYRPNANQAWIHVKGTEGTPTVIGGSLYLGGNSATLNIAEAQAATKKATLQIGSYVVAKNVFLGSNGENMVSDAMLALYHNGTVHRSSDDQEVTFSSITMNNANFAKYMSGVAVGIRPSIAFDRDYIDNTTEIGSLYFGGNRGSVTASGTFEVSLDEPVIIFEKLVAGCNNANYKNTTYSIDYVGGLTNGNSLTNGKKVVMNIEGITLKPGKLENGTRSWNTTGSGDDTRFVGGNIFGGCYESGIVQGDVEIVINADAIDESELFTLTTGVTEANQRDDTFSSALSVFGGGKGENTTIQGSTIINIQDGGSILKVFGGGLEGTIAQNTTINLNGGTVGKIYGGGFEGPVEGHTTVNLNGGTIYDSFGGACNSTIGEYAQTFIGSALTHITTVKGNVYGGNDFGGSIGLGDGTQDLRGSFASRITRQGYQSMISDVNLLTAATYVEYVQGKIENNIYGGSCGDYSYASTSPYYSHVKNTSDPFPHLANSFVFFNANANRDNSVVQVFGAGKGTTGSSSADNIQDKMQQRSYVLVDTREETGSLFNNTDVFGAGANCGVGMGVTQAVAESDLTPSAVVDLIHGKIRNAYGASYNEGFTLRTKVNVPDGSDISLTNIFGGGYGMRLTSPCDVYESTVYWSSDDARVKKIYGGNNNARRTLYSKVYISAEAWYDKSTTWLTTVYGAGYGKDTWSQYTEVHLNDGTLVYEAYGGGEGGKVLNKETVEAWHASDNTLYTDIATDWEDKGLISALVHPNGLGTRTNTNVYINTGAKVGYYYDNRPTSNNVVISGGYCYGGGKGEETDPEKGVISGTTYIGLHGGTVYKDLYAGGTYGGVRDLYGPKDNQNKYLFMAEANAFIEGGSVRNVYGAGWMGKVGYTELPATNVDLDTYDDILANDIPGQSNVVIGIRQEESSGIANYGYFKGVPAVERNVYGSGEDGGAVIGTAKVTVNNGYIGYRYHNNLTDDQNTVGFDDRYEEKINDETWWDNSTASPQDSLNRLVKSGNVFGGGYTDNATADFTEVTVYGGYIRNSVYGGGEVAAIGRGEANEAEGNAIRTLKGIYKAGKTNVTIYNGNILCNVFGGGKGFNNVGEKGKQFTNGYVFGQTEVNIRGGIIGTVANVANGDGNVFGGGNIGYVFNTANSKKNTDDGYYYEYDYTNDDWITDAQTGEKKMTEDCKVVVSPYAQVKKAGGINLTNPATNTLKHFDQYEYVPTEFLNLLTKDNDLWEDKDLDNAGVIIRNAVFAGGNVSSGNELYANTKTVFGNATATLNDLFYLDLITLGTEHIGGLYGDGNLTRVDGYRELNITNYGTDYYGMNTQEVTIEEYYKMTDRERAYFEVKYRNKVQMTIGSVTYAPGEVEKTLEEMRKEFTGTAYMIGNEPNMACWEEYGFVSVYAGRLLNTLQRADFVGVFGSRMVMQGARDRVPETVDFTDYTINRVGEVSLNQTTSHDGTKTHGNYFGIYNIVNYLGALTSDVEFSSTRTTNNEKDGYAADGKTFFQWKRDHRYERLRNDGNSPNMVALASGVYLELTTEKSTAEQKDWGYATGVMELDLINVMPGLGGGYVYAKNEHGAPTYHSELKYVTLSPYNKGAYSRKKYTYDPTGTNDDYETSGNFINSKKQIIDDCYPTSDKYVGDDASAAHYWYIKGQIYLYEQKISAYTGAPNAYNRTVSIPLTITAGSHGVLRLTDIKPSLYAYYTYTNGTKTKLGQNDHMLVNNKTYYLNDTISYWDWAQLSSDDQKRFVDETYVAIADCKIGQSQTLYKKGYVVNQDDYDDLLELTGNDHEVYHVEKGTDVPFTEVFRSSNNLSHAEGFALTFDISNPLAWDTYFTPKVDPEGGNYETGKIDLKTYNDPQTTQSDYYKSPTYRPTSTDVFGRKSYEKGDIISDEVHSTFNSIYNHISNHDDDAEFVEAYVLTDKVVLEMANGHLMTLNKGFVIPGNFEYFSDLTGHVGRAYYCKQTWKLEKEGLEDEYVYYSTSMTPEQITALGTQYGLTSAQITQAISDHFTPSWYCTKKGKYGGDYYETGHNYPALQAWAALNPEDRDHFSYNYDALDVLIDPTFSTNDGENTEVYDGDNTTKIYSVQQKMDYTAKYHGDGDISYIPNGSTTAVTITNGDVKTCEEYEKIPNEQYHYSPIQVTDVTQPIYVSKKLFTIDGKNYSPGNVITEQQYNSLSQAIKDERVHIIPANTFGQAGKYYYCRSAYQIGENGTVTGKTGAITDIVTGTEYTTQDQVGVGVLITENNYKNLPNLQTDFTVNGTTPIGSSTLYVSGQSDILELSRGKIYTLIYTYEYEESDESGNNIELITEKHVINIHVQFQGGAPTIAQLDNLTTLMPGSTLGLDQPRVTPGAYEVIGGGWEMYETLEDAQSHKNGAEFETGITPLYWYNDGYYLAYYAKTYLGRTYSNPVQFKIANYHDLSKVMADKDHHMYVDHPNVKRNSKIYIDSNKGNASKIEDATKNELDMLKDIYDLSLAELTYDPVTHEPVKIASGTLANHVPMDDRVYGAANLEFILKTDIAPLGYTNWTPIGDTEAKCFRGNLHGDGHTISELNNSLFNYLCGNVYNLGVTGTFDETSSGVADNGGYVENCWINTTGTITTGTKAVIGSGIAKNSYYPEEITGYIESTGVTKRPLSAFHNGEVAYDLNGFYLSKRYAIENNQSTRPYYYTITNAVTNTLNKTLPAGYTNTEQNGPDYVESRFYDGDFIYAGGTIPENANERMYYVEPGENQTADVKNRQYFPIYPDDYIYFGQTLTYGYSAIEGQQYQQYQQYPSSINRENRNMTSERQQATSWLVQETSSSSSNRVYRAPAYFGNKELNVVHFNVNAVFPAAASEAYSSTPVYPGLTAIDFTGYNDQWADGWATKTGWATTVFMPNVLDYSKLTSFRTLGQTQNLLAYVNEDDPSKTILSDYFQDQTVHIDRNPEDYTDGKNYGRVPELHSQDVDKVKGHLVLLSNGDYVAKSDHLLVDKQDFNAPISYTFYKDDSHNEKYFMWYQRKPELFVESNDGAWETISLPFTANLVTTQTKGEITHFYDGSYVGHEYWLRVFNDVTTTTENAVSTSKANFSAPAAVSGYTHEVANTFLWDYYYNWNSRKDANSDIYQQFYNKAREFEGYPLYAAGTPYLIGFPGVRYYEFDLSGNFKPNNAYPTAPAKIDAQAVTFISKDGAVIGVSDDDYTTAWTNNTDGSYTFKPTYQAKTITDGYLLKPDDADVTTTNDGKIFELKASATTIPFRAYMTAANNQQAQRRAGTRADVLYIGYTGNVDQLEEAAVNRGLYIYGDHMNIVIESTLEVAAPVTITTVAGRTLKQLTVQPGTKVTVPVNSRGVYIVNRHKIAVAK